jgi:hypothetical protein
VGVTPPPGYLRPWVIEDSNLAAPGFNRMLYLMS